MASESDDSDLRERVAELEATVEQQQATIKKMLPGRRGVLKAGGLLAGGGVLGALGSDQAAAADGTQDTSAGTIGAAGDSNDIYLDQLYDPDGDEILNVDDTGDINAAFGRTWAFNDISVPNFSPDSIDTNSLTTNELTNDSGLTVSRTALEAQTPIIDDWERQTTDYLSGDTGSVDIETSTVLQGSAAIALHRSESSGSAGVRTPFIARRGFRYISYIYFEDSGGTGLRDALLSLSTDKNTNTRSGDGYEFAVRGGDNTVRIARIDNGSFSGLASTTANVPLSEWLRVEVDLLYDDLKLRIFQRDGTQIGSTVTANDATYNPAGGLFIQFFDGNRSSGDGIIRDTINRRPI